MKEELDITPAVTRFQSAVARRAIAEMKFNSAKERLETALDSDLQGQGKEALDARQFYNLKDNELFACIKDEQRAEGYLTGCIHVLIQIVNYGREY